MFHIDIDSSHDFKFMYLLKKNSKVLQTSRLFGLFLLEGVARDHFRGVRFRFDFTVEEILEEVGSVDSDLNLIRNSPGQLFNGLSELKRAVGVCNLERGGDHNRFRHSVYHGTLDRHFQRVNVQQA